MPLFINLAGSEKKLKQPFVNVAGVERLVLKAFEKQGGAWVRVYSSEIVATIAANVNNINLSTLFTAADWASTTKKRVVINAGVVIAGLGGSSALLTGTALGGTLQIDNAGDIRGYGGAANSGAGGPAVNVQTAGVTINNSGFIRGGGGGGGHGGVGGGGGSGFFNYTASEGPFYSRSGTSYWFSDNNTNGLHNAAWAGSILPNADWSFTNGGYTYFAITKMEKVNNTDFYSIRRDYPATQSTVGGGGGLGGNGGTGQGGNVNQSAGSPGSPGGAGQTNAGAGGAGGSGGSGGGFGAPGSAGNSGNVGGGGNASGGSAGTAGTAGGAAGPAIMGIARTVNNTGTIQGIF